MANLSSNTQTSNPQNYLTVLLMLAGGTYLILTSIPLAFALPVLIGAPTLYAVKKLLPSNIQNKIDSSFSSLSGHIQNSPDFIKGFLIGACIGGALAIMMSSWVASLIILPLMLSKIYSPDTLNQINQFFTPIKNLFNEFSLDKPHMVLGSVLGTTTAFITVGLLSTLLSWPMLIGSGLVYLGVSAFDKSLLDKISGSFKSTFTSLNCFQQTTPTGPTPTVNPITQNTPSPNTQSQRNSEETAAHTNTETQTVSEATPNPQST